MPGRPLAGLGRGRHGAPNLPRRRHASGWPRLGFRRPLHRSPDAGATWLDPVRVPVQDTGSWDHPVVLARADRRGATRLAIVGTWSGKARRGFAIVESDDGGATFRPARFDEPPDRVNENFGGVAWRASSGVRFSYFTMRQDPPRPYFVVESVGDSFVRRRLREHITPWGFPTVGQPHATRDSAPAYTAWLEGTRAAGTTVLLARLDRSGGEPVEVSAGAGAFRARPMVAADDSGGVAVTWFEQALGAGDRCGDVWLRGSRDPGQTFSPPVLVSHGQRCDAAAPGFRETRWGGGGDYSGVAVQGRRYFVVWAAGSVGRSQLWGRWVTLP